MQVDYLKSLNMPDKPGVYFFYKGKEIFYIGKATSLRSRVRSYFGKDLIVTRGPRLVDMVFLADIIKWEETDSVLEALILEAELIKKYQPKYNVKDKDDKSFSYVVITKEAIPKVMIMRGKELTIEEKNSSNVFGPFTHASQLREAMKIVRPIFPYIDEQSSKRNNTRFYQQLGLSPDTKDGEALDEYKKNIANIKLFFQGKKKTIIRNLENDMKEYAKKLQFEKASEVKRQLFALKYINDIALLKIENNPDSSAFRIEAYDIAHMSGKNMVGVMTVVENNNAIKSEYKKFRIRTQTDANDTGALREVLMRRFKHPEWRFPNLIVVDGGIAQLNTGKGALIELGIDIPVVALLKDERHKPKDILGNREAAMKYKDGILLANSEAHRFAITYHKNMRGKNFLPDFKRKK